MSIINKNELVELVSATQVSGVDSLQGVERKMETGFLTNFRKILHGRSLLLATYLVAGGVLFSSTGCDKDEKLVVAEKIELKINELKKVQTYFDKNRNDLENTNEDEITLDPITVKNRFDLASSEIAKVIKILNDLKGLGFRIHPSLANKFLESILNIQKKSPKVGTFEKACNNKYGDYIPNSLKPDSLIGQCNAMKGIRKFFAQLKTLTASVNNLKDEKLSHDISNNAYVSQSIIDEYSDVANEIGAEKTMTPIEKKQIILILCGLLAALDIFLRVLINGQKEVLKEEQAYTKSLANVLFNELDMLSEKYKPKGALNAGIPIIGSLIAFFTNRSRIQSAIKMGLEFEDKLLSE